MAKETVPTDTQAAQSAAPDAHQEPRHFTRFEWVQKERCATASEWQDVCTLTTIHDLADGAALLADVLHRDALDSETYEKPTLVFSESDRLTLLRMSAAVLRTIQEESANHLERICAAQDKRATRRA